jgi:hypothetical protein
MSGVERGTSGTRDRLIIRLKLGEVKFAKLKELQRLKSGGT